MAIEFSQQLPDSAKLKHNSCSLSLIQRQAYTKLGKVLREVTQISEFNNLFQSFLQSALRTVVACNVFQRVKSQHVTIHHHLQGKQISPLLPSLQKSSNIVSISDFARKKKRHGRLAQIEFKLINNLDSRAFNVDFYYWDQHQLKKTLMNFWKSLHRLLLGEKQIFSHVYLSVFVKYYQCLLFLGNQKE